MYKIVVANQCGCFKNSNLKNNLTFESKDEALSKAIEMKCQFKELKTFL